MKTVVIKGQTFELFREKAILWREQKVLIISDLHLGKVTHFRKSGVAVPLEAKQANWENLSFLLAATAPDRLLILGDLFHSEMNPEWKEFDQILQSYPSISADLVIGNHDILDLAYYENAGLNTMHIKEWGPFIFTHKPLEKEEREGYNICGHVHPAVRLKGRARQAVKLPCFYFGRQLGILPAFGKFTGTSIINYEKEDDVFVIAGQEIIEI